MNRETACSKNVMFKKIVQYKHSVHNTCCLHQLLLHPKLLEFVYCWDMLAYLSHLKNAKENKFTICL